MSPNQEKKEKSFEDLKVVCHSQLLFDNIEKSMPPKPHQKQKIDTQFSKIV